MNFQANAVLGLCTLGLSIVGAPPWLTVSQGAKDQR